MRSKQLRFQISTAVRNVEHALLDALAKLIVRNKVHR